MKPKQEIIYFRESFISSIISDTFSFGCLLFTFWFNKTFIDGNNFLDTIILIVFFIALMGKTNNKAKRFHSKAKLLEYLNKDEG